MKSRSEQAAGAIFLIGLGLLFMTGWWWPGILFVIAASAMARAMTSGEHWSSAKGALWLVGIGLIFMFKLSWGFIWVLIGLCMLSTFMMHNSGEKAKRKNDEFDDYV